MKIMRIALAALALGALAACGPSACSTFERPAAVETADEKALYVVELTYAGGLIALEAAVDSGAVTGDAAVRAGQILEEANGYVVLARQAYMIGDAAQSALEIRRATDALARLRLLLGADPLFSHPTNTGVGPP